MKKKIFKSIFVIIAVLAVAWLINIARNLFIIYDLATLESQYYSCNNFSYEVYSDTTLSTYSRKGNISFNHFQQLSQTDHEIMKWLNSDTQESLAIFPNQNLVVRSTNDDILMGDNQIVFHFYNYDNFGKRLLLAATTLIYHSNINDTDCYSIAYSPDYIVSFAKKTGLKMHEQNGYYGENNSKKAPIITYFKNWKINLLTDEDVKKPNITGYNVQNQD